MENMRKNVYYLYHAGHYLKIRRFPSFYKTFIFISKFK